MKYTFFKATFMSVLLFISAISCTGSTIVNQPVAKTALTGKHKTRAIGNALLKSNNPSNDVTELKKRVEELEIIVKEQNKLIEIYKAQDE